MKKILFILMLAIVGSYGSTVAQDNSQKQNKQKTTQHDEKTKTQKDKDLQKKDMKDQKKDKDPQKKDTKDMKDQTSGQNWTKIGEKNISASGDKDELTMTGTEKYASIRIKPSGTSSALREVEVYFDKGGKQTVTMDSTTPSNGEGKVINLNSPDQSIKRVVFIYKTGVDRKNTKGKIEVWGLRANTPKK